MITPPEADLSVYQWSSQKGCKKATVFKSEAFDILKTVYEVNGEPPTPADYEGGPTTWANVYGDRRKYFKVGKNCYVW